MSACYREAVRHTPLSAQLSSGHTAVLGLSDLRALVCGPVSFVKSGRKRLLM